MKQDRFMGFDDELRHLVLDYEQSCRHGRTRYFDLSELEQIIDFYLDTNDVVRLERSVAHAEELFPNSIEVRLRRAQWCCATEQYRRAEQMLLELESEDPSNTDVQYTLGNVYGALGESHKAIKYYHRASADGFELGIIYGNIADEYGSLGLSDKAIHYYTQALSHKPEDERSIYNLAHYLIDEGRQEECLDFLLKYVRRHPYSKAAWHALSHVYISLHLIEKAEDSMQYAIAIDDTNFEYYYDLAMAQRNEHLYTEAIATLHSAEQHTDEAASIYVCLANIYNGDLNNYETALYYYQKAHRIDPDNTDFLVLMAECESNLGEHDTAITHVRQALETSPHRSEYYTALATVYVQAGFDEEAEHVFQQAIHLGDPDEMLYIVYASFLMEQGRYDEAADILNRGHANCYNEAQFVARLAVCHYMTDNRAQLYNDLGACVAEGEEAIELLFTICPDMEQAIDVANTIESFRHDLNSNKQS